MSEWRGFRSLGSLKIPNAAAAKQQSPFGEMDGPLKLDLKPKVRKRQFTGVFKSSDLTNVLNRSRTKWLIRGALAAFVALDIGLIVLFIRG